MIEVIIYTLAISIIAYRCGKCVADEFWRRMDEYREEEIRMLREMLEEQNNE